MATFRKPSDDQLLLDRAPAADWNCAYPIGNGTLGGMVFGGVGGEHVALNHDTLWSGFPRGDVWRNDGKTALKKIKELMREGKYLEADTLAGENFSQYASDMYMPLGDLYLTPLTDGEKPRGYARWLDLTRALCLSSYAIGKRNFETVALASGPDGAMLYRMSCTGGDFSVRLTLTSQLRPRVFVEGERLFMEGECPVTSRQNMDWTDRKTLYEEAPGARGIRFLCGVSVKTDGILEPSEEALTIRGATCLEVRLTAATSFAGYDKHPFLEGADYATACRTALDAVTGKDFDEMLAAHIKDYRKYYDRVALDLGSDHRGRVPTGRRLEAHEAGTPDRALYALLFHFGRYLTIASSRPGSQPTNLQGIWNPHFFAPWHSNYTVNINTEMNYYPTLSVGLPEMMRPLLRMTAELAVAGRRTAKKLYGAPGWVCHHNTDLWRHTQPVAGIAQWLFWNGTGGWLCHQLFEYYEFTLDKTYLRRTARPVMRGALEFYLSQLEDTPDGGRILFPATSPENSFACEGGVASIAETAEMSMTILRELCRNYIRTCEILGVNDRICEAARRELPRLRMPQIGKDGRLLEWYGEKTETEVEHRHVSHLYGLHPGHEITPEGTPALAEACRRTLRTRGDAGTGWSLAWKCNFRARLGEGDHAYALLGRQLHPAGLTDDARRPGGTYPNFFCAHPPFQIDGNFGATAGICEMLLQSDADTLRLLPACPAAWRSLSVRGLCAMGKRRVDMTLEDGRLTACRIRGTLPSRVLWQGQDITARFVRDARGYVLR